MDLRSGQDLRDSLDWELVYMHPSGLEDSPCQAAVCYIEGGEAAESQCVEVEDNGDDQSSMAVEDIEGSAAVAQGRCFDVGLHNARSQGGETHSAVAAVEMGVEQAPEPGSGTEWRLVKTWSEIVRGLKKLVVHP